MQNHQPVLVLESGDALRLPAGSIEAVRAHTVCIDPRRIQLLKTPPSGKAANVFSGRISRIELDGEEIRLRIDAAGNLSLVCAKEEFDKRNLSIGQKAWAQVPDDAVSLLD